MPAFKSVNSGPLWAQPPWVLPDMVTSEEQLGILHGSYLPDGDGQEPGLTHCAEVRAIQQNIKQRGLCLLTDLLHQRRRHCLLEATTPQTTRHGALQEGQTFELTGCFVTDVVSKGVG